MCLIKGLHIITSRSMLVLNQDLDATFRTAETVMGIRLCTVVIALVQCT